MRRRRKDHEAPWAIEKLGWQYHHIGIPHSKPRSQEQHVEQLGLHVCGFETSPYGIEWMRFEPSCRVPELVKTVPHVAFVVDDLDQAIKGRKVLIKPNSPKPGVRVAFIADDGAPVEVLEFAKPERPTGEARTALPNSALQRTHSRGTSRAGREHGPRRAARR